jgi:ubiquinone/menaquinone biosynthesis C-methylase UbiE
LARLTGERPIQGVTPDSLLALHEAGYRAVMDQLGAGTLLDLGCGQGFESVRLAGPERRVVGVDYSADALEHAHRNYADTLSLARTDALRLCLAANSFDYACSSHLIEHFDHPEGHVSEMARVLSPTGRCLVLTPNKPADFENPFHIHLFDPDDLRSMLGRYFEDVQILGLDATAPVKEDFRLRREKAKKVLALDFLDLRHRLPRSWYVAGYTRVLPVAYKFMAQGDSGGSTGITADDFFVTDEIDETTLVLFGVARSPRI